MLKIQIIPEQCIACGICAALFPNNFDYTDDGIVRLVQTSANELLVEGPPNLPESQKKCPTHAIRISSYKSQ
ncbi:MAG: ferredoxin [Streptococcaceae bacterium]|jgi:ferredoxin|nr:ferredoxin [Streptococcaceae bacterium]MCH4177341.1 ferredoxin [Streptococcaceae bacterium]